MTMNITTKVKRFETRDGVRDDGDLFVSADFVYRYMYMYNVYTYVFTMHVHCTVCTHVHLQRMIDT